LIIAVLGPPELLENCITVFSSLSCPCVGEIYLELAVALLEGLVLLLDLGGHFAVLGLLLLQFLVLLAQQLDPLLLHVELLLLVLQLSLCFG
jgi:hypothetical protein